MHWPYYRDPDLCQRLCFGFVLLSLLVVLVERPGLARRWSFALVIGLVAPVAAAAAPSPLAVATLVGSGIFLAMVACAALFGRREASSLLPFAVFAVAWSFASRESVLDALLLFFAAVGVLLARHRRADPVCAPVVPLASPLREDVLLALVGALVACLSARFVTGGYVGSGDEWANEYQAALFAKGRAYGAVWPCFDSLRMFYVFWDEGRTFSQYTPGYPAYLAPFVRLGLDAYAQAPLVAVVAVAVARVARRLSRSPRWAGPLAALFTCASTAVVTMAGTRFPHLFVAACFAVSIEATLVLVARERHTRLAAVVLGLALGACFSARPQDGVFLATGPLLVFAREAKRGTLDRVAAALVALAGALVVAATSVVLRVQLGRWFALGYDLNARIHPWNVVRYSVPPLAMLRWHLPLLVGGSTWFPLSPVLAVAGFAAALGGPSGNRGTDAARVVRGAVASLAVSSASILAYYASSEVARGVDAGPSPRYQFVLVVPMAVGTALFATELVGTVRVALRRPVSALLAGAALAILAIEAPRAFGPLATNARSRSPARFAAEAAHVHGAIVYAVEGSGTSPPWDWPQNLPLELYPPDNVYALWGSDEQRACVERAWPGRATYRVDHWDAPPVLVAPSRSTPAP